MPNKSYSKFVKYYSLNEVSKFTNVDNLFSLSKIKSITIWFSLDLSLEKSKSLYNCKSLLGILLIYFITNKYPKVQSSKDRNQLHIESYLVSSPPLSYMLEFSGLSDLTGCLCLAALAAVEAAPFALTDHNTIASGAQSNVIAWSWIR